MQRWKWQLISMIAVALACGAPTAAMAKSKGKSCASAEQALLATGQGDSDGDGLSDCRESKQLRTRADDADTDDDGVSDGDEMREHCDPLDPDSDGDGSHDGDDDEPGIPEQKVEAFLDALTCPAPGVPGSIGALGITAQLNDFTEFDDVACADLAALLGMGGSPLVEIEILEDSAGTLTAAEVELEDHGGDDDEGHGGGEPGGE